MAMFIRKQFKMFYYGLMNLYFVERFSYTTIRVNKSIAFQSFMVLVNLLGFCIRTFNAKFYRTKLNSS